MALNNIRNHPYTFEQTLQNSADYFPPAATLHQQTGYFTWLVFMQVKWVPFDAKNQTKLEQTLNLGGTFVDIQDSNFPGVNRVRAFPKSYYISYLGVKYRLSRVMQPDAWIDPFVAEETNYLHPSSTSAMGMSEDRNNHSINEHSYLSLPLALNPLSIPLLDIAENHDTVVATKSRSRFV